MKAGQAPPQTSTSRPLSRIESAGANIPGKPLKFLPYLAPEGVGGYRRKCAEIAANDYEGFTFSKIEEGVPA